MRISIGDVVRIKSDQTLGTVVSITTVGRGAIVHLHTNGLGSRVVAPQNLEHVARAYKPMTAGRSIATLAFLVIGLVIAVLTARSVNGLGAGLPLTVFVAMASGVTVANVLTELFNRPRALRL
ncbi:hypothetical protein [Streptomyces mayteni]